MREVYADAGVCIYIYTDTFMTDPEDGSVEHDASIKLQFCVITTLTQMCTDT
jgi:hypothetical protein